MTDTFDLQRFVDAQKTVYGRVLDELAAGRKTSHWMWFVFPQIAGLGRSFTARRYAIHGIDEARAYLSHPVLGPRLRECTRLVLDTGGASAEAIFGFPDYLKFRSCMTLFDAVAEAGDPFRAALDRFYDGRGDDLTRQALARE